MINFLDRFERIITMVLILLMIVVVTLATFNLVWGIFQEISKLLFIFIEVERPLDLFGLLLLVLIGIELLDTIRTYRSEHVIHGEGILVAALIAISLKSIVQDVKKNDPLWVFGIAAIILAVYAVYRIVKRTHSNA